MVHLLSQFHTSDSSVSHPAEHQDAKLSIGWLCVIRTHIDKKGCSSSIVCTTKKVLFVELCKTVFGVEVVES